MVYYVYGVWESVCSITTMVSGSLYVHHRRNITYRLPDTIDVIEHTDSIDVIEHSDPNRRNITYRLPDTIVVIEHTDSQTPVCSITTMVSGSLYVLLRLLGSECSITSMESV
jgi:hypothetical protein